jgi:23S rRNA pseudouridine2605 synthase
MKKDNSRRPDRKSEGKSGPEKGRSKFGEKKEFSSGKDYKKSKPYGDEAFEKKDFKKSGFSKDKDYSKSDFKKSGRFDKQEKPSYQKRTDDTRDPRKKSEERESQSVFVERGSDKKPAIYRGPREERSQPKDTRESRKSPVEEKKEGEFKSVYRGRGKDEKPIYEMVPKSELPKETPYKKKFKKPFSTQTPQEERPQYNFDKLEKNHGKKEFSEVFRLNKYISNSGICSRREADQLILKGEITVNGEVVTELGHKVLKTDKVIYKGKLINPEKPVYILMNKPKDFITTTDDPMERKTVMHLLENACKERVFPVGRLDRNTTGLLLFTNDGDLAAKLSHPSNNIKKIYQVTLDKPITSNHEKEISEGLTLEDGPVKVDDIQVLSKDRTILGLEIHVGKNRIVRRIFAHLGYEVVGLDRVMYAGLDKKDLPRGKFRFLSEKEVVKLKYFL